MAFQLVTSLGQLPLKMHCVDTRQNTILYVNKNYSPVKFRRPKTTLHHAS